MTHAASAYASTFRLGWIVWGALRPVGSNQRAKPQSYHVHRAEIVAIQQVKTGEMRSSGEATKHKS